ncbi:MAG TPA: catalase family protein [Candidatus Stackebrandtia faecavium]|nr:catalase family protein [Candidatus Stackebrandtia faecavium]
MVEASKFTPDVERTLDREEELTREILAQMAASQQSAAEKHRHAHRDAHAKSHAVLKATLTVHADLPSELAQGIFSRPGSYDAVVRMSSSPGDIHPDRTPAPRGCAIKVMGVDGDRLLPDLGGHNQDFLMVNFPTLAFGTAAKYKDMLQLLEKNAQAPETLQRLGTKTMRLVREAVEATGHTPSATLEGLGRGDDHVLGETYYTQGALRYGDYIAKLSLAPKSPNVRSLTGENMEVTRFSAIRDLLVNFFRTENAEYELRAQLSIDTDTMPVEDAAVLWKEEDSPHCPIATLHIESQDAYGPKRRVYADDVLTFNPWNGVAAHQPLGSIMRIRKAAYQRSTQYRHEYNARQLKEPAGLDEIPD